MTPRIAPGSRRQVGLVAWAISQGAGRIGGTNAPNLFLTLGRNPRLFRGWLRFAGRLMPGGTLPRRETELVILRVAHHRQCLYEFEHHVRLGARAGVGQDDVLQITQELDAGPWSTRERALLCAVDALHFEQDLNDGVWGALGKHLNEREIIELCFLVGHYEMLATVITALGIEPDTPRHQQSLNV
jgi:AhpD family alkylhydroperoxidase